MLSNPFHVDIMFFQGVFGKKNPDNGIYGHAFAGIENSLSALVIFIFIANITHHCSTKHHWGLLPLLPCICPSLRLFHTFPPILPCTSTPTISSKHPQFPRPLFLNPMRISEWNLSPIQRRANILPMK